MDTFFHGIKVLAAVLVVLCQQALLIGLGLLLYERVHPILGVVLWLLCIPMLKINKQTYRYILKNGLITFYALNADTSEIDVPRENSLYQEKSSPEK